MMDDTRYFPAHPDAAAAPLHAPAREWLPCGVALAALWSLLAVCLVLVQQATGRQSQAGGWGLAAACGGLCLLATLALLWHVREQRRRARADAVRMQQLQGERSHEAEANRAKSAFLAAVSHELRTPLNALLGFSELIRDLSPDAKVHRYAELIHESGCHLHSLVNTLLDLGRIEAGRMEMEHVQVDVVRLLGTLVDIHRVTADRKGLGLALQVDLPKGMRIELETDRTKLTQVIHNALHNAVKFTATGGIWVVASVVEGCLLVRVIDTGPGITAQQQARLFEPYACGTCTGGEPGTGLGLSLSRRLVELMGGSIQLFSQPGQGTQLEFTLPGARLVGPLQA